MAMTLNAPGARTETEGTDEQAPEWMADPKVEALLARLGVSWEWIMVSIDLIDATASRGNQARLNDIVDESRVEEYAEAMKRGDTFPGLVGHALGDGTFFLNGGNHRLAAARRAQRSSVGVYLIRTNDAGMRHLVTVLLNTLEGVRPSRADLLAQCIYAIEHYGYESKAAALQFSLPLDSVQTERRRIVTRGRLAKAGVGVDALSSRTLDAMHSVSNDVAFREAASVLTAAKLPDADARQFITEIREQRTEAGASAVAQQWRDRDSSKLARAGLLRRKPSGPARARASLVGALNMALTLVRRRKTRAALGLTGDDDMAKVVELGYSVVQSLEDVRNATA